MITKDTMKIIKFVSLIFIFVACFIYLRYGDGNIFGDKWAGIWVSENVVYYDYSKYKYDVFPIEKLPNDLFTERYLQVIKIERKDKTYDVTVSSYHLGAINKRAGNYVGQLNDLKQYDSRDLIQGTHDSKPIVNGNTMKIRAGSTSTIIRRVPDGKRTKEVRDEVHDNYVLTCENGIIRIKEHYYETLNGQRIDEPQNNISTVYKSFRKMNPEEFNHFCDELWAKSFEQARNIR